MSQDIISDALNQIMNAKRTGKEKVVVTRFSKVLINILEIAKKFDYIESYKINKIDEGKVVRKELEIKIKSLNECRAIKPRYNVAKTKIDFYMRRYLPARGMGIIIISTNQGLMTHQEALEKNIGGSLIAYFY